MRAEQTVLTDTISRSYFNFKNCYTGRFILSHFTFQYNLQNINQTVNFRVSVFLLSPRTFKQDKQENKLNACGGLITLTVRRGAFAGGAWQNALKMESVPFLEHRMHTEGQWGQAKKPHTSHKSTGPQIPQLWLYRTFSWRTRCGGVWVDVPSFRLLPEGRRGQGGRRAAADPGSGRSRICSGMPAAPRGCREERYPHRTAQPAAPAHGPCHTFTGKSTEQLGSLILGTEGSTDSHPASPRGESRE